MHVFKSRNFTLASSMSFLLGLALFGAMTFLPLYQQTVQHASPTVSGLLLIPMMLGSTVTSLIAGRITVQTGKYKILPILGGAIMTLAMFLLSTIGPSTSRVVTGAFFVIFGVGMGFLMQITTLIAQNSVGPKDMGVASSSRSFFQQIGGSIGVSIFGVVFFRALNSSIGGKLPGFKVNGTGGLNPAAVQHMPVTVRDIVFGGIAHGLDVVFIWAAPSAAIVFALAWLIKEIPLRGRADGPQPVSEPEPEPSLVS